MKRSLQTVPVPPGKLQPVPLRGGNGKVGRGNSAFRVSLLIIRTSEVFPLVGRLWRRVDLARPVTDSSGDKLHPYCLPRGRKGYLPLSRRACLSLVCLLLPLS